MSIKQTVIKVNDIICYAGFILICFGAALVSAFNPVGGVVFGFAGLIIFCLTSGAWFVLSNISEQAEKQTALLQEMLKKQMEK